MASLLTPRRTDSVSRRRSRQGIQLQATVPVEATPAPPVEATAVPLVRWPIAAGVGAVAAAFVGWVLMAGFAVVGWFASDPGSLSGALGVGTQFWLLANGAGAQLGTSQLTVIPWGAAAVHAWMLSQVAGFAVRQTPRRGPASAAWVVAVTSATYALVVVVVALLVGQPDNAARGAAVALIVAAAATGWGSCHAVSYNPTAAWPPWARALPRAVLAAWLVMVAGGAAALMAALVARLDRVEQLTVALDPGVAGGIALLVVQLAFLPNLIIWASSFTLGAGFTLGTGSVVTPAESQLGLVPGIPVFGALPVDGPGGDLQLLWLGIGVLAGAAAAWCVMRARPAARFDETSLVGGLAGLVAGLLFVPLGWASVGDLGTLRLAGMGPQLTSLTVMATTTMGLSGVIVGLAFGLLRKTRS